MNIGTIYFISWQILAVKRYHVAIPDWVDMSLVGMDKTYQYYITSL